MDIVGMGAELAKEKGRLEWVAPGLAAQGFRNVQSLRKFSHHQLGKGDFHAKLSSKLRRAMTTAALWGAAALRF
jgi:broad specificity phosphatase PhoE